MGRAGFTMKFFDAAAVAAHLDYPGLIAALKDAFRVGCDAPTRHHHTIGFPDGRPEGTLLIMPAWDDRLLGIKTVTVMPANAERGLPSVAGIYMLMDKDTGQPQLAIDGVELTVRRTAAASALAASFLARENAATMLMVGAGALAPHLVSAHCHVRPIRRVMIWNRNADRAAALARRLNEDNAPAGVEFVMAEDLAAATEQADIVSCATLSQQALIKGAWLRPGTHLDLVGAFRPDMRESDDEAVRRSQLFVDTLDGALSEAGDIVQPLKGGVITREDIKADLAALCRGDHPGRVGDEEITLFKSTGCALEDLAAAAYVWRRREM